MSQAYLVSEKHLQARIIEAAAALRWKAFHPFDSRRSAPGWPDLAMVRPPRLVFAELKSPQGKVTVEQQQWLEALSQVPGVETYIWRPSDLQSAIDTLR